MKPLVKLMLDSGAFSAWNRGEEIKLKDYVRYVKDHIALLDSYINLDVIPGSYGRRRYQDDVESSAKASYANLQKMKALGLTPIPVFHQGERFDWLERMLKDGEPYIGFSPSKDVMLIDKVRWLDNIFTMLCDEKKRPLVKSHGFGTTAHPLLTRYPWTTVDSTTWSLHAGMGHILVPPYQKGPFNYHAVPITIVMSGVKHKTSTMQKKQFEYFARTGEHFQAHIRNYCEKEIGISITDARYDPGSRRLAILMYFMKLQEHINSEKFEKFSLKNFPQQLDRKPLKDNKLVIMFATMIRNKAFNHLLTECGANSRLMSYYETRGLKAGALESYVTTGGAADYKPAKPRYGWHLESYLNFRRKKLLENMEARRDPDGVAR